MAQRRCRGICSAAGLLRIAQFREIGLCEAEIHGRLDRICRSTRALKSIVRVGKQRSRIGGPAAARALACASLSAGVACAPVIATPLECRRRAPRGSLGSGMTASRQQPLDLDDHLSDARIPGRSPSAVRRSSFCCVHDVHFPAMGRAAPARRTPAHRAAEDATPRAPRSTVRLAESSTTTERPQRVRRHIALEREPRPLARDRTARIHVAEARARPAVPRAGEFAMKTGARAPAIRRRSPARAI